MTILMQSARCEAELITYKYKLWNKSCNSEFPACAIIRQLRQHELSDDRTSVKLRVTTFVPQGLLK